MKKIILLTCFAIIFISFIKCSINKGIRERRCDKQKDFKIKGILLDGETGAPLPGGIIYLLDKKHNSEIKLEDSEANEYIQKRYVAFDARLQAESDLDGVYQIKNIPEGEYRIVHRMNGYRSSIKNITLTKDTIIVKRLWPFFQIDTINTKHNDILIYLKVFGKLNGNVSDSADGSPLDSVAVFIGDSRVFTDENGFYLFSNIKPSNYTVRAEKYGYETAIKRNVIIEPGRLLVIDFKMLKGK